jgi:pimeloyl-ACP methyl ester carboxylesterase
LHGYGGTFAHYSKIFNQLSQKFYIVAIDLPGMGSSSKEHINISNYEETRSFFTGTIEAWRI